MHVYLFKVFVYDIGLVRKTISSDNAQHTAIFHRPHTPTIMYRAHTCIYNIAGYFRGVYISRISKWLQLTKLIFVKLIENHTQRVQSLRKLLFRKIQIYTPRK